MLVKRIITATIAIPILLAIVFWSSETTFLIVIMLTASLALIEFYRMNLSNNKFTKAVAIIIGLTCIFFIYYYRGYLSFESSNRLSAFIAWLIAFITLAGFIFLLMHLIFFPREVFVHVKIIMVVVGIIYVSLFLSYLMLIRSSPDGKNWVFFTFMVVWFGDSGAYTLGSLIGKHQIFPLTSPKKTVEGALGGLVASVIAAFAAKLWFMDQLSVTHCTILALGVAIVSQLGDACESTFKRRNSVKDSGNLLPGHGGMLDRIDGLLFTAPFIYYYKVLIL